MDQQARRVIQLRLKREELANRIRQLAKEGAVSFSDHALDRMEERGISDLQVQRVLTSGEIRGAVEPGRNEGEWKCKVVDRVKGMREVGVATLVIRNAKLFVKTVEWEDPK